MTQAVQNPISQWVGLDGRLLQNGQLFFGLPNQNPETSPITVYWDMAMTQPAAQPVRTINGMPSRNGTPSELFFLDDYSVTVREGDGRIIFYSRSAISAGVVAPLLPAANTVSATGNAAQDSLNLREAIRIAPKWGVIQIVGRLQLTGTFIVKPCLAIINGGGAQITHLTPNVNLFELKDDNYGGAGNGSIQPPGTVWDVTFPPLDVATNRTLDAFPGFFRIHGLELFGQFTADTRQLANNEPLGVFTKAIHSGAFWMENNGQHNQVVNCRFADWDHAIYSRASGRVEVRDVRTYNCKFGVHIAGDCHQSIVDGWFEYGFIGLAVSYGAGQAGLQTFIHTLTYDGVYQSCFVGNWFEGLYQSSAGGSIYYELNLFRDLQIGWAGNQCVAFEMPTVLHASPCSGTWPGNPATPYTLVQVPAIPAPHNLACPVDIWQGVSIRISTGVFGASSPTGARPLVQVDGASDKIELGYDRGFSTTPWAFGDQGRVALRRPGQDISTTMARLAYYTWQKYWGNSTDANFGGHNDAANPSGFYQPHAWQGLVNFSNGVQRSALVIGTKRAVYGSETALLLAGAQTAIGDPDETEIYFQVKAGPEWGFEQGYCEFTTVASVIYNCNQGTRGLKFSGQVDNIPTIASATSMDLAALSAKLTSFVSGTAAIQFINPGTGVFPVNGSRITFIPTAAWTTVATGNIARAITAVVNQPVDFIYNVSTGFWYPK